MVGMNGRSGNRNGYETENRAVGSGLGLSTSAETLPSPSPSPLSSPLSRSFSAAFPRGTMAEFAPMTEKGGDVDGFGFTTAAAAATMATTTTTTMTYPQRVHRPNPLLRGRDAVAKRRRDMFLNKVRLGRDEWKWGERGEQVCFQLSIFLLSPFCLAT